MNVLLKPELEKFIDDQVQSGRYDSTADAINAAVARLQAEREIAGLSLDDLRAEVRLRTGPGRSATRDSALPNRGF